MHYTSELLKWLQGKLIPKVEVQQTGSIVAQTTILSRSIRTSSSTFNIIDVPNGAIGVNIYHVVHGITGTFDTDEGHNIKVIQINPITSSGTQQIETSKQTAASANQVTIYPGANLNEGKVIGQRDFKIMSTPLGQRLRVDILIDGTFESDEGIDSEVIAEWIL